MKQRKSCLMFKNMIMHVSLPLFLFCTDRQLSEGRGEGDWMREGKGISHLRYLKLKGN